MGHSVAFYTLGCKLNYAETSTIGRQLSDAGMDKVNFTDGADMYVINTCSVTDQADRKCRKVVKEALRYNPNAYIVIVGCYAQLKPTEIATIPGVDLVLGAAEKFNLVSHLHHLSKEAKTRVLNAPHQRDEYFCPGFQRRRPHPHFHESTRRLRLFLHLLHHSPGAWKKPFCQHTRNG